MKWIPVSERLPEIGSYVSFVNNHDGKTPRVYTGTYENICGKECFLFNAYRDDYWGKGAEPLIPQYVTHWMPLPEPPTEQKGEE